MQQVQPLNVILYILAHVYVRARYCLLSVSHTRDPRLTGSRYRNTFHTV